jgi:hypothetical protein
MGISGARSGGPDTTETGTDDGYQRAPNRRTASSSWYRTQRQNDGHRLPNMSAERITYAFARGRRALSASGSTRHAENRSFEAERYVETPHRSR